MAGSDAAGSEASGTEFGRRILVYAPFGRDASLICHSLGDVHLESATQSDMPGLIDSLDQGAGTAVISEEVLKADAAHLLGEWLARQPAWSDFPIIVLTGTGESTRDTLRSFHRLKALGNVTLLERPVRVVTLITAVETALRSRRRQYEVKAYLEERTAAESALAQQAHDLVVSNADLQQFAYVTSHDLQEPLRTIHSYAQLLQRRYAGQLDADAQEFLGYITAGANRMHDLIQDLLTYSRVINLERRPSAPVEMDGVVIWAMQNLQLAVSDSGADISFRDLPSVSGDRIQLVQLMQNLLSNAIKYRTPGVRPEIRVAAEHHLPEWRFSVRDNGIGMDPEYHEKIFGLFKRLHGRDIPGTGIGLAICRKIVEQHGGRMWVESAIQEGSTFYFTLPD